MSNIKNAINDEEIINLIKKYIRNEIPLVTLKGNPNSAGTRAGGAISQIG